MRSNSSAPRCPSYYDRPPIADLMELREVLWRKYQRKKLPWEDLVTIDRLISEAQGRE